MLSEEDKSVLRHRYEDWGLDAVKDDLKRPSRWVYGSSDRTEFAKEWVVEAEERAVRRRERRRRWVRILAIAALAQIGLVIALLVSGGI